MQTDPNSKQNLPFWETPRNLMIITCLLAAIVAAIAGILGYQAGQQASRSDVSAGNRDHISAWDRDHDPAGEALI